MAMIENPDVILIGAGIMSATLGTVLKELESTLNIVLFEMLHDHGAVDEVDPKFRFIWRLCQKGFGVSTQIVPRRVLGLIALRKDKCVTALGLAFIDRSSDQVV
jgi:hypothetical protein